MPRSMQKELPVPTCNQSMSSLTPPTGHHSNGSSNRQTVADHISHLAFDEGTPMVANDISDSVDNLSLTPKPKDSDSISVSSRKSALEHNSAWLSRTGMSIFSAAKHQLEKVMPKTASSVEQSLEILAAFEILSVEQKRAYSDATIHPEIVQEAVVSRDNRITPEELAFQKQRLHFCRESFARYIGVPVDQVQEEDIPIIAVAGSGGGFKAMLGTTGYLVAMEKDGLFDSVMYLSGVSGSCWTLSNLYRSAVSVSPCKLADLFLQTLVKHPGDPTHLNGVLAKDPVERVSFLFGGLVHKRFGGLPRGVVDMYAVLMQSHFFSQNEGPWDAADFKWSLQKKFMDGGRAPIPILTCIRHERPWLARVDPNAPEELRVRQQKKYEDNDESDMEKKKDSVAKQEAWWQWFELSPLQFGSDELQIWIPTWSFGRKFEGGKSANSCPEQSFALQVGLVGSAMTAPFQTSCETLERSDPKSWIGAKMRSQAVKLLSSDTSMSVKELLANHPFHSAYNWNPMYRLLPAPQPPGLVNSPRIQLIDAGADNNQPLYPFVRPGRGVDIIFVLDSSEDVERNIVTPDIEIFGKKKGIQFTRATPTPPTVSKDDKTTPLHIKYQHRYCQIFEGTAIHKGVPNKTMPHGDPAAEKDVTLVYIPTITNDAQTPSFCPSDFSFAKLQYTKEEAGNLMKCAELNWVREREKIRQTVRQCWEKKRDARLAAQGK